jgi:hypothetical protein
VTQRLRALWEEPWAAYPNEELKAGCLALYEIEKAQGTELRAIIGVLQEYIELEEDRLRREQEETYRRNKEEERIRLERKFLLGADCGWTRIEGSEEFYCRRNGRTFRIARGKDKRWRLYRITSLEDAGGPPGDVPGPGRRKQGAGADRLSARAALVGVPNQYFSAAGALQRAGDAAPPASARGDKAGSEDLSSQPPIARNALSQT